MNQQYVMALDIGFAHTGIAVFDVSKTPALIVHLSCVRPKKDTKKKHLLVADSDIDRVQRMVRGIVDVVRQFDIGKMVVEMPSGGAQGARANRAMGIATGMIVSLKECLGLAAEYYSPNDTREAAVGRIDPGPKVRKGMTDEEKKRIKQEREAFKKGIKMRVMEAMEKKYPELGRIDIMADKEHIADAVSTFEAAKNGNLVLMSRGV